MIKSHNTDQTEIILNIMELCGIDRFDADVTFGNGMFYKNINEPALKFDIDPQRKDVVKASSDHLPLDDASIFSMVFDPPFLTYVKAARDHNSIMAKRFGGYWRYDELQDHYTKTIVEAYRVLRKRGIMVIKCQDIIHNHRHHPTHINITQWMDGMFRLKDLFVLSAKNRMPIPQKENERKKTQKHARIHHSFFMVLERL